MRIKNAIIFILFSICTYSQSVAKLEKVQTFFPYWKELKNENIDWYNLSVPENYDNPNGKKIKLAVTVLHSLSTTTNNPVIFLQGGPGGSTISGLWRWLGHPLRKTSDIILIDLRGTGFSEPSLCPDLGNKFFEILSKNQNPAKDEKDKVNLAIDCQQDLIDRGIDINSYNSFSVSKDLNGLKNVLKINKWNVYSVSYGTFLAQEYAKNFPDDIKSLILDSSIPNISEYYEKNTSNYLSSLNKLFLECKNNPECNREFPDLAKVYFSVIKELEKKPITVKVDKKNLKSGQFTYNSEDFKIAIHQSLYQKKMIEVLPLLIYQFHERNQDVLSALAGVFSVALSLDYGTYYCFSCNEALANSNIVNFNKNAKLNPDLNGGLSFYKSDFDVCKAWNRISKTKNKSFNYLKNNKYNTIIFSGEFDPITSPAFADETASNYNKSRVISANSFGHAPSFSETGNKILYNFLNNSKNNSVLKFEKEKVKFQTNIFSKKGIYNLANDLNNFDWIFFSPLLIAFFILGSFIFHLIFKKKQINLQILHWVLLLAGLSGLLGMSFLFYVIFQTSEVNFYILAFGVPSRYICLFFVFKLCALFTVLSLCLLIKYNSKVVDIQFYIIVVFSLLIINFYLYFWGLLY